MNLSDEPLPWELDVKATKSKLDAGEDMLLLDCRERDEHDLVHIEGSTLIPMSEIQARLGELEPHRGRFIVVHCHLGRRSMQVTQWLRGQGFAKVQNMTGGIDAWSLEIDPSLPRY